MKKLERERKIEIRREREKKIENHEKRERKKRRMTEKIGGREKDWEERGRA